MSNNLSFKRKFFILKNEYSNMRNLNPKGHGKLELRNNRLSVSININNAEKNQIYNAILIGENKVYELGKIHTDNGHSGKSEFNYNYKDVESMGFPLEKVNAILILRDAHILLGGYLDKDDRTIENYISKLDKEVPQGNTSNLAKVDDSEAEPPNVSHASAESDTEEAQEQEISMEQHVIVEQNIIEEASEEKYIKNDLHEYPDETEPQETYTHASSTTAVTEEEYHKALQEVFNDSNVDYEEEVEYIDSDTQKRLNQKNQTTNYVLNIMSFFPYVEPFKINLMGYNWWKIEIDDPKGDKGFLPYFSYISGGNHKYPLIQNTVTATALMRKHGHYLFGLYNVNDEVKFYVYGVPGDFTSEDHPQRGSTGFNTWYEGQGNVGYWLLYIDPLTGRIIYPINPMMPKD